MKTGVVTMPTLGFAQQVPLGPAMRKESVLVTKAVPWRACSICGFAARLASSSNSSLYGPAVMVVCQVVVGRRVQLAVAWLGEATVRVRHAMQVVRRLCMMLRPGLFRLKYSVTGGTFG